MFKNLVLYIILTVTTNVVFAGQTFATWCTNDNTNASLTLNTKIVEFDGIAIRSQEQTGLYYQTNGNVLLSNGLNYYIANSDKSVYDIAKIAYLTNSSVDACTIGSNMNSYIVGVKLNTN